MLKTNATTFKIRLWKISDLASDNVAFSFQFLQPAIITIPAEKAYGDTAQGDIPANSPLKFIVLPVKSFETIKQPDVPSELEGMYGGQ